MIKKELTNKKVVRAIALGLSAVMLTTPMTALANGLEEAPVTPVPPTPDDDIVVTNGIDTKSDAIKNVEGLVETAQQSTTDAGITLNFEDKTATYDSAEGAAKAAGKVNDTTLTVEYNDSEIAVNYGTVAGKEEIANEHLDNVEEDLVILDQTGAVLDEAAEKIDTGVDNADKLMDSVDQSLEDANNVVADAEAAMNAAQDVTATEDEVKEAIANAQTAVDKATVVATDAEAALNAAKDELDAALKAEEEAKAKYELAQTTLGTSQAEIDAAFKAAEEAEKFASLLKDDVDKKQADFDKAQAEALHLLDLQQKMYDEADTITKIYDENSTVDHPDDGDGKLFDYETANTSYWNAAREYFKAYMQYIFNDLKDNGKISNVSYHWQKGSYSYDGEDYKTAGGNAYIIKYTDVATGEEVTRYFNYHTTDFDGNIAIYEKFEGSETIKGADAQYNYAITDENGNNKIYLGTASDITVKDTITVEKDDAEVAQQVLWVADKDSADTTETEFDEETQSIGEVTKTTKRVETVTDYDNIIGYDEENLITVENTDSSLPKVIDDPFEYAKTIFNYTKTEGNTVTIYYNWYGYRRSKTFDNDISLLELGQAIGTIFGGEYEVTYYKQEATPIYGEKTVIIEDTYATVTTTTTTVDNLNYEHDEAFDTERELVSEGYWDETTAEEVAIEAGNREVAEKYSQYLEDDKYEVKVTPKKKWHSNEYTYEITVIEKKEVEVLVKNHKGEPEGHHPTWSTEQKALDEGNKHAKEGYIVKVTSELRKNHKGQDYYVYGYVYYRMVEKAEVIKYDNHDNGSYDGKRDYVDPVYTVVATAEEKAKEAAEAEKQAYIEAGYKDADYVLIPLGDGKYSYKITGTKTTSITNKSDELVSSTTYDATEYKWVMTKAAEPDITNKWLYENRAILSDVAAKAMEKAVSLSNALELQKKAAADAYEAAKKAKDDVEAARKALRDLKVGESFAEAMQNLTDAQARYKKAEENLFAINKAKEKSEVALETAKAELDRFIPTPPAGGTGETTPPTGGGAGTGGTTGGAGTTPVVPGAEIAEGGAVVTPVATGAGAGAGAAQNLVDIEDEDAPLAAGIDNADGNGDANGGDGEEVLVAGAEDDGNGAAIVDIEDEETPLAAGSGADGKMSWWWLLIVALLGATGYKMYKDHQKKKEEAAQEA